MADASSSSSSARRASSKVLRHNWQDDFVWSEGGLKGAGSSKSRSHPGILEQNIVEAEDPDLSPAKGKPRIGQGSRSVQRERELWAAAVAAEEANTAAALSKTAADYSAGTGTGGRRASPERLSKKTFAQKNQHVEIFGSEHESDFRTASQDVGGAIAAAAADAGPPEVDPALLDSPITIYAHVPSEGTSKRPVQHFTGMTAAVGSGVHGTSRFFSAPIHETREDKHVVPELSHGYFTQPGAAAAAAVGATACGGANADPAPPGGDGGSA